MNRHRLTPLVLVAAATTLSCSGSDDVSGSLGAGGGSAASVNAGGATSGGASSGGAAIGGNPSTTVGGAGTGGNPTSGGATSASGGSQSGGASLGGSQSGGANSGGRATGGATNVGGSQSGGANSGGRATGGATNVGGSQLGGASTGGSATGGVTTGGQNTNVGGTASGGKATGGASTGGKATGGAATGGSSAGGASTCPEGNTNLCGMVVAHNAARAAVNPAPATPLPTMTWDASVAAAAQSWADQCNFSHYTANTYGQNIYASAGGGYPSAQSVVDSWVSEKKDYNYAANTCSGTCGHYTQVVWRNSINLGCGIKYCTTNSPFSGFANWYIVVCNYLPPGNYNNQKPY